MRLGYHDEKKKIESIQDSQRWPIEEDYLDTYTTDSDKDKEYDSNMYMSKQKSSLYSEGNYYWWFQT